MIMFHTGQANLFKMLPNSELNSLLLMNQRNLEVRNK